MTSEYYFYDQFSQGSHIGGVHRSRRDFKDLNQALYQSRIASAVEDYETNKSEILTPNALKKQTSNIVDPPIIPELLTKELDTYLNIFNNKSKKNSISNSSKLIKDNELNNSTSILPKISLPSSLIVGLHSTWSDLIKNTEYKYKTWRTKTGEDHWHQYIKQKNSEQIKSEKQQDNKTIIHRRRNSHVSIQSGIKNTQINANQSSLVNTTDPIHDHQRSLKTTHQSTSEHGVETIKHGIHVEFRLSTQLLKQVQKIQIHEQKFVLFDVPKQGTDFDQELINLTQNKCKRLLAETKQKILATNNQIDIKHPKICQVWFYDDNPLNRNKNNLLLINEFSRRQKSKFILSVLRHEIPQKYNINIDIPETKRKCYIELIDGSTQIYYPSGRLAVLRLRSPFSTTLFYDDTGITAKQFLGLVTSTGNIVIMQPTFHARFITNNQHESAYLCNGKTGVIEKQFQSHFKTKGRRQSIPIDENDTNLTLLENTVQIQLNSFMQLEYNNPTNIRFAFTCHNEEFKFQLGAQISTTPTPTLSDTPTPIPTTKKFLGDNKSQRKRTISTNTNISEKHQQGHSQKQIDEQLDTRYLLFMKELNLLKERFKNICDTWLKEYRTVLGIMDIDAYCFSDISSTVSQPIDDINQNQNVKQFEHVPILTKRTTFNIEPMKNSAKTSEVNIITNSIEQFIPHSDVGRAIKQRIYSEKKILTNILPAIK
ncbi:unnamed protein product [Adineta steineri]|uniref:FAM194 C-terminal domain-containing protein n=1 Tax=Adineta steineri TaxID=433720 RepID=A0A814M3V2_9BILA|nr:unnamed protein product [Adineta steineri]CAF1074909.1 unnamed protein product [Adineta steineri]CAF1140303.1 unnamed protein product [Adineta steineri]CAF1482348.1 unnamed protein product [Adineta steineri]